MGEPHQDSGLAEVGTLLLNAEDLALEEIARPPGLTDFRLKNDAASPVVTVAVGGIITGFGLKYCERRGILMCVKRM